MSSLFDAQNTMTLRAKCVEDIVRAERPELLNLLGTYENEAIAARHFIDRNLSELNRESQILEVGGGILALAVQLASEGYKITTVEPVGEGFSGISYIMKKYLDLAASENLPMQLIELPIEDCVFDKKFDFIFSINVMEHLADPYTVLIQIVGILKPKGRYRFFCPNYDFPYEPHFAKWLFMRRNRAFHLSEERAKNILIQDAEILGLYKSLNFITLSKITKFAITNNLRVNSNSKAFYDIVRRSLGDSGLKERHGGLVKIVQLIEKVGLIDIIKIFPVAIQPVMDIEVTK